MTIEFGREVCGTLQTAESREWLVTNGIGGYASGTVAGLLTRRYHGLLVAALNPPLGRTLLLTKFDEIAHYNQQSYSLSANRWADRTVSPEGYRYIERFFLEGTTPVWQFSLSDAQLEKRIWMEPGCNTTYVKYTLSRATQPLNLTLKAFVNYRDYHGSTQNDGWQMSVEPIAQGIQITAFPGATPLYLHSHTIVTPAHEWYYGFDLAVERDRGLSDREDHLHAATFTATLSPGAVLTLVASTQSQSDLSEDTFKLRSNYEQKLIQLFEINRPIHAEKTPDWIHQLVLSADQFIVDRPSSSDPTGKPSLLDITGLAIGDVTQ